MTIDKRYSSIKAISNSLGARISRISKVRKTDPNKVKRQLVLQCFLSRLYKEYGHEWVLKGATGILQRFPDARFSMDIDLAAPWPSELDDCISVLTNACGTSASDPFGFLLLKYEPLPAAPGVKASIQAYLGDKIFDAFTMDIVFSDITPDYDLVQPVAIVPFAGVESYPHFRIYQLEEQIADKLYGMYTVHTRASGLVVTSTRYRDLADLTFLVNTTGIDFGRLENILKERVARNGPLPKTMIIPGEIWVTGYPLFAINVNMAGNFQNLDAALAFVGQYLNPVLQAVSEYRESQAAKNLATD